MKNLKKCNILISQASLNRFKTTGESSSPPKENTSASKHEVSSLFSLLWVIFVFLDWDSQTQLNPDPIRNTGLWGCSKFRKMLTSLQFRVEISSYMSTDFLRLTGFYLAKIRSLSFVAQGSGPSAERLTIFWGSYFPRTKLPPQVYLCSYFQTSLI